MLDNLNGATRVHIIVGDPIAQVKSPYGMTEAFESRGHNALCIPAHVSTAHLKEWFQGVSLAQNVDGIIVTIPHKFDSFALCQTVSDRAKFLGAVNTIRRNKDGSWHGDMLDGLGYVKAIQKKGFDLSNKRALLIGAGGAGSAIGHGLVLAGVSELAVHDEDQSRRALLIAKLQSLGLAKISTASPNAEGFDVVINASPAGMKAADALPVNEQSIQSSMFVGCVVTAPAVTPLIELARSRGCNTTTGADMFNEVRQLMIEFLMGNENF
jgi:shikimate dehydrogenase